jgi:hypothetical protein
VGADAPFQVGFAFETALKRRKAFECLGSEAGLKRRKKLRGGVKNG